MKNDGMPTKPLKTAPLGSHVRTICSFSAFVPAPPARNVELNLNVQSDLKTAEAALKRLNDTYERVSIDGVLSHLLPRQEAVASLAVDGISVPVSDLYAFRAGLSYVNNSDFAWLASLLAEAVEDALAGSADSTSLKSTLLMHQRLFADRSSAREVGMLRRSQTWVGGDVIHNADYVPPPPEYLDSKMREYFDFISGDGSIPNLVTIALSHYFFEAVHPFCTGNGIIGRVHIAILLKRYGLVSPPVLTLSEAFAWDRATYREVLKGVSEKGDLSSWLSFFLRAVTMQAESDERRMAALAELYDGYVERLDAVRCRIPGRRLAALLFENPYITRARLIRSLGSRYRTPDTVMKVYRTAGVIGPINIKRRSQTYCALRLLRILESAHSGRKE